MQSYESLRLLGEALATAGFHAVRVHYDGTGESPGTDEDPGRIVAWLRSIEVAADALRAHPEVRAVGLVGLRFGGTLAALAASRRAVAALALWEPCVSGAMLARELEILASAAPVKDSPDATGKGGILATVQYLSPETLADMARLDLHEVHPLGSPPVLIAHRDDRPAPGRLAEHLAAEDGPPTLLPFPGYKEMMTYPERSRAGVEAIEGIVGWARDLSADSPRTDPSPDAIATERISTPETEYDGVRYRVVRVGPSPGLFGVLTTPLEPTLPPPPPVLTLSGGIVPATAVNGLYRQLAERLARCGRTTLRVDIRGIAESPGVGGERGRIYPENAIEDVDAAAAAVAEISRGGPPVVVGLCSGAYWGFRAALRGTEVRGLILINPLVLGEWPDPERAEEILLRSDTGQAIRSLARWKRLLRGQSDVRPHLERLAAKLRHRLAGVAGRVGSGGARGPQGVAGEILELLGRGVSVDIVFSEHDRGQPVFARKLGRIVSTLEESGLHTRVFGRADHVFNSLEARAQLLEWLTTRLTAE